MARPEDWRVIETGTLGYLLRYSALKPGALPAYRRALQAERLAEPEMQLLAWRKTTRLLQHAYDNVPYYRSTFDRLGLNPKDIRQPEHFAQVPLLTRDNVIEHFDSLFAEGVSRRHFKIVTTGGSTGTPVKIGLQRSLVREVPKWQMLSWWGLSPAVDMATIYRETPKSRLERLALGFVSWPAKVIRADATRLSPEEIDTFISEFRKCKPKLLHGYAGALDAVAEAILKQGISMPPPVVVWSTAAPLSKVQEATISAAFRAPVCDQYGCSEIYFVAAECPEKAGLHIFYDSVRVEFLDDLQTAVPEGRDGNIVLTNLNDYCFPLIRYANGDVGRSIPGGCPCGRGLPLMDKVSGRISDKIVLPDGTILAGEYLTTIFDDCTEQVSRFQVVQTKAGAIDVRVVFRRGARNPDGVIAQARHALEARIGQQVPLSVRAVPEIKSERGKLQFVIRE